jgi:hypothetical protein
MVEMIKKTVLQANVLQESDLAKFFSLTNTVKTIGYLKIERIAYKV